MLHQRSHAAGQHQALPPPVLLASGSERLARHRHALRGRAGRRAGAGEQQRLGGWHRPLCLCRLHPLSGMCCRRCRDEPCTARPPTPQAPRPQPTSCAALNASASRPCASAARALMHSATSSTSAISSASSGEAGCASDAAPAALRASSPTSGCSWTGSRRAGGQQVNPSVRAAALQENAAQWGAAGAVPPPTHPAVAIRHDFRLCQVEPADACTQRRGHGVDAAGRSHAAGGEGQERQRRRRPRTCPPRGPSPCTAARSSARLSTVQSWTAGTEAGRAAVGRGRRPAAFPAALHPPIQLALKFPRA